MSVTPNSTTPPKLADLRMEHFAPLVDQAFTLQLPEGSTLQLRLVEATAHRQHSPDFRPGFSLLFRCPELPAGQYISQNTYTFEHPALGQLDLFMVPIEPDQSGMRYQCIFS